MPIGRKLYYGISTGDIILEIDEKHHENAVNTTKEQDFQMYSVLSSLNPDSVELKQLNYGELRNDFRKAKSYKVDLGTNEVIFDFPEFELDHSRQIINIDKDAESLGQSMTDAELENMRQGQKQSDLELRVLELEVK